MTQWALYIAAGILLLGAAVLLLRYPGAVRNPSRSPYKEPAEFFPVHCRFFPQVRQAFSSEDTDYLASRASPGVRRSWEHSRRKARRLYLAGLGEDFARLNRLSRLLSLHSPRVEMRQEANLLWLNLRFQLLYGMVLLRILMGQSAAEDLGQIASLVGGLGSRLEQAALALNSPAGAVTP
jgi:hypothetical protein